MINGYKNSPAILSLIFIFPFWISPPVAAQQLNPDTAKGEESVFFSSEDPVKCSLTFDIREFINEKMEEKEIPAVFSIYKNDGTVVADSIFIESRGSSRKEICYFPPIKLKLKNSSFNEPYLDRVKKLKLVTHCNTAEKYEQYLLKEYLVYKLYNLITDKSFHVQLAEMDYIDAADKVKPIHRYAFLIEDEDLMAERNNCVEVETENLKMKYVEPMSMVRFSLFQFMIGNVDWKMEGLHNVKLLKSQDFMQEYPFIVPYDFDHSGFVDAGYAVNVRNPEISSVQRRIFTGLCFTEEEYLEGLKIFRDKKPDMYNIINSFQPLTTGSRNEIISYLDKFYKVIEKPNFYKRYILSDCTLQD